MAKILDIIPYKILPAQMGGQKGIALFCKYLGERNDLTCISVKENNESDAENYQLIRLFGNSRLRYLNPFYVRKIRNIVRKKNILNIITEHPYMAWMGWLLRGQLKIKWFVHSHNIEYERFRTLGKWWFPVMRLYEKWTYTSADAVFFKTPEDAKFAVEKLMVKPANALLLPFGIELKEMPVDIEIQKKKIYSQYNIPEECTLIFFNGAFDYKPNLDALVFILGKINPVLFSENFFNYRVLICGKGLPESFDNLRSSANRNIIYAGFVHDIVPYFKAADIFLNPIVTGGGVKTKIVEAMGYGATVISCTTGAAGINLSVCGDKIKIVPDNDANAFVAAILQVTGGTPASYYGHYYWGNIVNRIGGSFPELIK